MHKAWDTKQAADPSILFFVPIKQKLQIHNISFLSKILKLQLKLIMQYILYCVYFKSANQIAIILKLYSILYLLTEYGVKQHSILVKI